MDLYDIFQQYKINKNHTDSIARVKNVSRTASENSTDINSLNQKIDHLSMVVMAMGELMEDVGISKNMLLAKVKEIDLRDGKLDGKLSQTNTCVSCSRTVSSRHAKCLYCGAEIKKQSLV